MSEHNPRIRFLFFHCCGIRRSSSALPDLTAGVTFKPVVNRLMGIHESDLYDNAIINIAVGIVGTFPLSVR